jgi:multiple sugar transport system permease protein
MKLFPKSISMRKRESLWGYLFISPWIIGFLLFTIGPMIASLVFSFADYDIISPPTNFGLSNYIKLFTNDPDFWHSLGITAIRIAGNPP